MHSYQLDEILPALNPLLRIRRYHDALGLNDGIYLRGEYICAIQQGYIPLEEQEDYKDNYRQVVPMRSLDNLARTLISNDAIKPHQYWDLMRYA